ncbi:MAG: phosphoprotein [Betanucleorhabdovirus picridis]|uniref:Phosphoprotein n=1 Tax=Picris betanucleorhabdovirus 1 TaxID=2950849 RepID=A0AAE9SK23_9RHAB|nr:MAG: phosphoprotein [Picris betanucleorhabdovirus 1]UTQ50633.1 MAG: phosphoprotein [Picris betanucleorhabdovirus 1]
MNIHPAFSGISKDASKSEVMTGEIHDAMYKSGVADEAQQEILGISQVWSKELKSRHIILPDEILVSIATYNYRLLKEVPELDGAHLLDIIVDIYQYVAKSNVAPAQLSRKMDDTLDNVNDKLNKMELLVEKLLTSSERQFLKPSSKTKKDKNLSSKSGKSQDRPKIVIHTMQQEGSLPLSPTYPPQEIAMVENQIGSSNMTKHKYEDDIPKENEEEEGYMMVDNPSQEDKEKKEDEQIIDYSGVDPKSKHARELRTRFEQYYSCAAYNELSPDMKHDVIKYFAENILMMGDNWSKDPEISHMIEVLTNKDTVLACIEAAEKGDIPLNMIHQAQFEICSAVETCGAVFCKAICKVESKGGIPYLTVIKRKDTT